MKYQILVDKVKCDHCGRVASKTRHLEQGGLDFCDKNCLRDYQEKDKLQGKLFPKTDFRGDVGEGDPVYN